MKIEQKIDQVIPILNILSEFSPRFSLNAKMHHQSLQNVFEEPLYQFGSGFALES
jgi:hypothetical protein